MADIITLSEFKEALRNYEGSDFDDQINFWIPVASEAVYQYLDWTEADYETSGGLLDDTLVPDRVKGATALLVGYLMNNPDMDRDNAFTHGQLPWFVTAMLYPLRDPALA